MDAKRNPLADKDFKCPAHNLDAIGHKDASSLCPCIRMSPKRPLDTNAPSFIEVSALRPCVQPKLRNTKE